MTALLVALAAAGGAVLRYVVDQLIESTHDAVFPFGTLVVNLSGSFALGIVTGLALHHGLDARTATVLGAGALGGYTTFSTWAWESVALVADGDSLEAVANVAVTVVFGALAAAGGLAIARM